MDVNAVTAIGSLLGGIGAISATLIAWSQLSNLNESVRYSNLMTIFDIEFELNRRKERLSEIRTENSKIFQSIKAKGGTPTPEEKASVQLLENYRKEAYENYLNVFDRLCYFVLKKKLNEEDFRLEYRDMLFKTIEDDAEGNFNTGTRARNMIKLYNQWKDK
tara:strand:+ start:937 stop:1422 length:486 start_codon:yes stop_codon:yes gene_type:complete